MKASFAQPWTLWNVARSSLHAIRPADCRDAELCDLATADPRQAIMVGRAVALIEAGGSTLDAIELMDAAKRLDGPHDGIRRHHSDRITQLLYRALARAELKAPAAAQGAFVPAGNVLDAFAMVGKILGEAEGDVLIVDRYANNKVLTDFAVLAPDNVTMRLLTTEQY